MFPLLHRDKHKATRKTLIELSHNVAKSLSRKVDVKEFRRAVGSETHRRSEGDGRGGGGGSFSPSRSGRGNNFPQAQYMLLIDNILSDSRLRVPRAHQSRPAQHLERRPPAEQRVRRQQGLRLPHEEHSERGWRCKFEGKEQQQWRRRRRGPG